MKNASDIFKDLPDGSEFAPPIPEPIQQIHKAQRWCEAYDFEQDHAYYAELIHAFIAGYGTAERDIQVNPLIEALEETLSEMEALMRKNPAYRGGINIAERARAALSLQNDQGDSQSPDQKP